MIERKDKAMLIKALDGGADVNAYYADDALKICPLCKAVLVCDTELTKLLVEEYSAKIDPVCTFYAGGNTKLSTVTPKEIATSKYIGKCKGRNTDMIEYFLFAEDE